MSENNQQGGFLRNLPVLVKVLGGGAGIAAVIAAFTTLVTAVRQPINTNSSSQNPKTENPSQTHSTPPVSLSEKPKIENPFKVDATSPNGTRFSNNQSSTKTYRFFAKGNWSYNPGLSEKYGAEGYKVTAGNNYKLSGFPEGSLIVRRRNSSYEFAGSEKTLTLDAGESVNFTINDAKDGEGYNDNSGYLTVEWQCDDCQQ